MVKINSAIMMATEIVIFLKNLDNELIQNVFERVSI